MNRLLTSLIVCSIILTSCAQKKGNDYVVTIKTNHGDMVAILYDETPKHKANFIKLTQEKFYDSLLFHRVIEEFMIQGGDPNSKNAEPGQSLGNGGPGYTVDAEFVPQYFHEKGAFSAARLGDEANPAKASSGSQFYIVQGKKYSDAELTQLEQNIQYSRKNISLREVLFMPEYESVRQQVIEKQNAGDGAWLGSFFEQADTLIRKVKPEYKPFVFTDEQRARYKEVGGSPHLDGDYTVFGRVIKGLEVIDKIAAVTKGPGNRPVVDVHMVVTVEEMSKKKIEKTYGYNYPASK
ncbi:MAG: peptidylprolyl isomerase [Cyclobacteriaceae bacterium]|nr:peptidylprolyl isomerase [Cyclobacteriaceae bacterium]